MRNFARINNYYNRIEAVKDWQKLADEIAANGIYELDEIVVKHTPPEGAGWRKIDKCIDAMRTEYEEAMATSL